MTDLLAGEIGEDFARRWSLAHTVIDIVHEVDEPVAIYDHPLVRQLAPTEALELPTADVDLLSDVSWG